MVNKNFYKISTPYTISEIAKKLDCEILIKPEQDVGCLVEDVKSLTDAGQKDISFLNNKKYLNDFYQSNAAACIVPDDFIFNSPCKPILLKSKNSYFTYKKLIDLFYKPIKEYNSKIAESAYISKLAKIGKNCYVGHNVVIEDNAVIGDDSIIESGSFIDFGVKIGKRARIYSNVSISYAEIGDDVLILPGVRIGQDGFGFATAEGVHHKIFHTGRVLIGNDVEIGANSTIDRGSLNDTIIEDLCRIDNLVQIAHNVHIGRGSVIAAQVGIAGSSKTGHYCAFGGQVGIAGHLTIGDQVQISGQGGAIQDINSGSIVGGTPTMPIRDWHRQSVILKQIIQKRNKE